MCIRCAACSRINKGFNLFLDFPTFSIDEKVGKKSRPLSLLQIEPNTVSIRYYYLNLILELLLGAKNERTYPASWLLAKNSH